MNSIHIRTDVISIRVYDDDKCYDNKDKYIGVVTGYIISDTRIHLTASHGTFDRNIIRKINIKLRRMGFTIITFERHGSIKEKK